LFAIFIPCINKIISIVGAGQQYNLFTTDLKKYRFDQLKQTSKLE